MNARRASLVALAVACVACGRLLGFDDDDSPIDAQRGQGDAGGEDTGAATSDDASVGEDAPAAAEAGAPSVFVTSRSFTGALGGTVGADTTCAAAASAAGLSGEWTAWVSTASSVAVDRLASDRTWTLFDGRLVAASRAELTSGTLRTPIELDERGAPVIAPTGVWTGTNSDGTASALTCADWTGSTSALDGEFGDSKVASTRWTSFLIGGPCDRVLHLYCFQR